MADNGRDNDEYQFVDVDAGSSELTDYDNTAASDSGMYKATPAAQKNIKRNALLAVLALIIIIVLYSGVREWSAGGDKKLKQDASVPTQPIAVIQQPVAPIVTPTPVVQNVEPDYNAINVDQMDKKLSSLELTQQTIQTDNIDNKNKLSDLKNSTSEMMTKIAELNQMIVTLTSKIEEQSLEVGRLTQRLTAPKRPAKVSNHQAPPLKYYLQAVIPGRAWIIATNGATQTVREGTLIAGYGAVKLIDARQGRVTTGSGQVIRFSPEDS